MPLIVRLPVIVQSSPSAAIAVETNVIVACFSTSKKSAERMCASRCSLLVSMLDRSMATLTDEAAGSSPVTIEPSNFANRPFTLLTIMWRTEKDTSE